LEVKYDLIPFSMPSRSKRFCELCVSLERTPRKRDAVHLPFEILFTIISFVQLQRKPQGTLHSCCLVSRSWYSAAVVFLYKCPVPSGEKYLSFVRTMYSSKNVHKFKSPLWEYVKSLDLSAVSDNVPERVVEKLLGRVERGLEVFVAPNTEFS
jgi:hypothetical protein